jgi:acyl-CoA synthetase (AMP-forming)/AMP-acid ligase II
MIELLRAAAAKDPDHVAIASTTGQLSYAELTSRAERTAAALRARGVTRFAALDSDPAVIWTLLAAGSLIGAESCIYPPAAPDGDIATLRERFGHDLLISSRVLPGQGGVLRPDDLLEASPLAAEPRADPRPLLILTSGTTGPSKAAVHHWARVLRMAEGVQATPEHRWLLAYGLNQFGGLQILIHVAAAMATLVAGQSFRPRDGLAAMRRWDVTHASGTPTFWRFLLAELRGDGGPTPALRQVSLSGEAVPASLLDQLKQAFPQARLSQIYGATEMGQTITVRDGLAGLPLSFLEDGEVTFKVVDGELWVRTRSAMLGYFGERSDAADVWRPTGDLVEIVDDRIQFRGRKTDVINVGGVKIHPLPIEELVCRIEGVALARVFGRPNPMVGHIVALEVVPQPGADDDELRAAIRAACADLPPAARPRSIKLVESLETPGNKVIRGVEQ